MYCSNVVCPMSVEISRSITASSRRTCGRGTHGVESVGGGAVVGAGLTGSITAGSLQTRHVWWCVRVGVFGREEHCDQG
eukprot:353618-Chlamydomonas_euryale.AAC.17